MKENNKEKKEKEGERGSRKTKTRNDMMIDIISLISFHYSLVFNNIERSAFTSLPREEKERKEFFSHWKNHMFFVRVTSSCHRTLFSCES